MHLLNKNSQTPKTFLGDKYRHLLCKIIKSIFAHEY